MNTGWGEFHIISTRSPQSVAVVKMVKQIDRIQRGVIIQLNLKGEIN